MSRKPQEAANLLARYEKETALEPYYHSTLILDTLIEDSTYNFGMTGRIEENSAGSYVLYEYVAELPAEEIASAALDRLPVGD